MSPISRKFRTKGKRRFWGYVKTLFYIIYLTLLKEKERGRGIVSVQNNEILCYHNYKLTLLKKCISLLIPLGRYNNPLKCKVSIFQDTFIQFNPICSLSQNCQVITDLLGTWDQRHSFSL